MRSQTCYIGKLNDNLITWHLDQGSLSTGTAESEIKAVNWCVKREIIFSRGMLDLMGFQQETTIVGEDNKASVDASFIPTIA